MGTLGKALYKVGFWVRETGQAMDRLGSRLQGHYAFKEPLSRHRTVMNLYDRKPEIPESAFVAPSASIIGDVIIGQRSSVWYGCVLRGDVNYIRVGSGTNIQDNSIIHVAKTNVSGNVAPTIIGDNVTIGHNAVLHACTIEDNSFVGMGSTLLDGAVVEKGAMVAAGALVTQNTCVPTGQIWAGNPARFLRNLTEEETEFILKSAENYSLLSIAHAQENEKNFIEIEADKVLRKKWLIQTGDSPVDTELDTFKNRPIQLAYGTKFPSKGPY